MPPVVTSEHRPTGELWAFFPYPWGFLARDTKTTPGCQVVKGERTTVETPVKDVDNFWGLWTTWKTGWDISWKMGGRTGESWDWPTGIGTGVFPVAKNNSGVTSQFSPGDDGEVSCVGITIFGVIHSFHAPTVKTVFSPSSYVLIHGTGHTTGKGCDNIVPLGHHRRVPQ